MLYKRGPMKNFSKFTDKQKNKPSGGVLSKDVLENFAKLTEEHLSCILCFSKVAGSKPETVGSSCCRSSVRKGIPKNLGNFTGRHMCWSLFLIKLQLQFSGSATLLKQTPTLVFSCEIYKLLKNNFFEEHL